MRGVKIRKVPSKSKISLFSFIGISSKRSKSVKPDATDHLLGNRSSQRVELELECYFFSGSYLAEVGHPLVVIKCASNPQSTRNEDKLSKEAGVACRGHRDDAGSAAGTGCRGSRCPHVSTGAKV